MVLFYESYHPRSSRNLTTYLVRLFSEISGQHFADTATVVISLHLLGLLHQLVGSRGPADANNWIQP